VPLVTILPNGLVLNNIQALGVVEKTATPLVKIELARNQLR